MATLAKPEAPADPVAHHGFVVDPPAKLGDPFTVRVPDFDELYVFEIRRWEARGATIPMAGDEVLVVVDDEAEPWVPMWWPGGGDAEVISLPIKSSQIESLEASKITGQLTNAQIESIEAAKLTGQIIETQIGPEAITTPKLAAGAVVAAKIAAGTITAEQIAAATITATNIAANTITASQIKAGTITAEEIAAATITGNKIAATTIEGGHIKAGTITATNISAGTITAVEIKAAAITGTLIAAGTIEGTHIKAGTIEASNIKSDTITATQIAAEAITTSELAALSVTSAKIAAGTIVSGNIAAGGVTAGNITVSELSALSANLGSITAGTVTGATLQTGSSGKRVVLNTAGLRAYNATEEAVLDFSIETGDLKLKGAVEPGSTIPATTVTGQLTNAQLKEIEAAKIAGKLTGSQMQLPGAIYHVGSFAVVNLSSGTLGFYSTDKPETATRLYVHKTDAHSHSLIEWLDNLVSAAEPLKGQLLVQSLKDSSKLHVFKVTGLAAPGSNSKRFEVTWLSGSGTFETEEEVQLGFQLGAVVAESLTAGYIAAGAVTTGKLAAEAITAEKIAAGTITTTQIAANTIEAADIKASTITTTEIAANTIVAGDIAASTITATQIAAETITGAKIAASTITAAKLTVSELSAITANLGSITAGTITGATFRTSGGKETVLDSTGLHIIEATTGSPGSLNSIEWKEGETVRESLAGYVVSEQHILRLEAFSTAHNSALYVRSHPSDKSKTDILASANAVNKLVVNENEESSFLQLTETAKRKVNSGTIEVEWAGGAEESKVTEITHALGVTPKTVLLTPAYSATSTFVFAEYQLNGETKIKVKGFCPPGIKPGAGTKAVISWAAIG